MEIQNYNNKYLPIGSVVLLTGGKKRVMITGYRATVPPDSENGNKAVQYDYNGGIYPEGIISSDQILLFNHSQIEQVFCLGFQDEESQKFHDILNTMN